MNMGSCNFLAIFVNFCYYTIGPTSQYCLDSSKC